MTSLLAITLSLLFHAESNSILLRQEQTLHSINKKAEDWQLTTAQAKAMVDYYKSCSGPECHAYTKLTKNKAEKKEIRKENDIAAINFRLKRIKARFTEADEAIYRRQRGLSENDPRGDVGGYSTKILRVRTKKKNNPRTGINNAQYREFNDFIYFSIDNICPPPDPC